MPNPKIYQRSILSFYFKPKQRSLFEMKAFFLIAVAVFLYSCQSSQSPKKEQSLEKSEKEIDKAIYSQVTKGAEQLIFSYESLLNKLLAADITKEQRDSFVHNSIFSGDKTMQIFDNPDVIIEDDIGPEYYSKEKVKDLKVSRYLSDMYLFLERSQANKVKFENIQTLQVKVGEEVFVIVYFESKINGLHSLERFSYEKTKRIATIKAEKKNKDWNYSIMSVGFYEMSTVKNSVSFPKSKKKV